MEENSGKFGRAIVRYLKRIGISGSCYSLVVQSNLLKPSSGHILKIWVFASK